MLKEVTQIFPLFDDYSIEYRNSISGIRDSWNRYGKQDVFFRSNYLETLEKFPPKGMQFRYICVLKNGKTIGLLYFQLLKLNLSDSLKETSSGIGFLSKLAGSFKSFVARFFETHVMISGNSLVTGDYASHFLIDMENEVVFKIIDDSLEIIRKELVKEGIKVGVQFKKDYYDHQFEAHKKSYNTYSKFEVQPNMVMKIDPLWNTFDDYLASLKSKYRVRAKRAFKKAKDLTEKELFLDDLRLYKNVMYDQYLETVAGVGFNLFYLNEDYFIELKKTFDNDFRVFAYFIDNKMIGFYTCFNNFGHLEAHFLGYDHKVNERYQSYLNFLYDMVAMAIENKSKSLCLSRTAMEIKSSVGAEGTPLSIFLKYNNRILNAMVPSAIKYFVPEVKWKPRHPFK